VRERSIVVVCFEGRPEPAAVAAVLADLGVGDDPSRWTRWHRHRLLAVKADPAASLERVEARPEVRRVFSLGADHPLARGNPGAPRALGTGVGGPGLTVIAGPCSVESRAQVEAIAHGVKAAGANAMRGGAFKPRTSPYDFGGLGEPGLEMLALAREATGLPVVTEALNADDVDVVSRYADVIQIGSRNMNNYQLLLAAGSHPAGLPVLLKRGWASNHTEYLMAAEYVLLGRLLVGLDDRNVILCERGVRAFENETRFTLDVGAIPLLRTFTDLPIIADPSHAAGRRDLVPALARAAVAAGADGLLIEVHVTPDDAWSDARQVLSLETFEKLMKDVRAIEALGLQG